MRKSIKSSKIMVMTERFEVCKYSGGRKEEKQKRDIKKKERERKSIQFWRSYI